MKNRRGLGGAKPPQQDQLQPVLIDLKHIKGGEFTAHLGASGGRNMAVVVSEGKHISNRALGIIVTELPFFSLPCFA